MEEDINNEKSGCCVLQYIPIPLNSGATPTTYIQILSQIFEDSGLDTDVQSIVVLGFDKKKLGNRIFNCINLVILSYHMDFLIKVSKYLEFRTAEVVKLFAPTEIICSPNSESLLKNEPVKDENTSILLNDVNYDSVDFQGLSIENQLFLKDLNKVFIETTLHNLVNIKNGELGSIIEKNVPEIQF